MTIHFHTKHFQNNTLPLIEYMLLIMYEYRSDYKAEEICELLKISYRTAFRIRKDLIQQGFLKKNGRSVFELTDKLYK